MKLVSIIHETHAGVRESCYRCSQNREYERIRPARSSKFFFLVLDFSPAQILILFF